MSTSEPVTGHQAPSGRDYMVWIRSDAGQQFRRDIDLLIRESAVEVLGEITEHEVGRLSPTLATDPGLHGAEHVLDARGRPLRLSGPNGAVHTLHTRAARREWREAWAERVARVCDRAVGYAAETHRQFDALDGTVPVLDAEGVALTGDAEFDERRRRWVAFRNDFHWEGGTGATTRAAVLRDHRRDLAAGALSTDVAVARLQLMDRLDDAANDVRRWLLDDLDDTGAGAANAGQRSALDRLEARRQDGRRNLRAAATITAARAAFTTAEGLMRGIGIEDAPVWRSSAGSALAARHVLTAPAPSATRWACTIRAVHPASTTASKAAADLGAIALDAPAHVPAGWTVESARRPAPNAHEIDVTVAQTSRPSAGIVLFDLTARNACGPRDITLVITVPPMITVPPTGG